MRIGLLVGICLAVWASPAHADVELASIFGDDMVLQRDCKIAIWGRADAGEAVTVTFMAHSASTTAGADGRFRVSIGPLPVAAARELRVEGRNTITLTGVCVGDVWICSGQSNMAWPVKASANAEAEIADSLNPRLRLFTVPKAVSGNPLDDFARPKRGWQVCGPKTIGDFSAVAYYFGRQVRQDLGIPIGLVASAWGGTPAEAWTRRGALASHSHLSPILTRWDAAVASSPAKQERNPRRASGLWNGMVAPLTPMGIRGVIWYQGEANVGRAEQYTTLFPTMIRDWRRAFAQGDQPFLFVQLANLGALVPKPRASAWAELRDAQRKALSVPNTAMAVTIDIGEAKNIHPKNKQEVGRRLALAARALAYPADIESKDLGGEHAGPRYERHDVENGTIRLGFSQTSALRARDYDPLRGFTIAGEDRVFRPAHVRIELKTIVVWHPQIKAPVAVRYAWADNPMANLINAAGLPASPFRTDDWPGVTAGKR